MLSRYALTRVVLVRLALLVASIFATFFNISLALFRSAIIAIAQLSKLHTNCTQTERSNRRLVQQSPQLLVRLPDQFSHLMNILNC